MAQRTVCFRSNAGNDFPTEYEALCDDLRHFIQGVTNNPGIAREIMTAMVGALQPRYAPQPEPHLVPETEFDGIARLIARLAETKPTDEPQLDLRPGKVMRADPVDTLTDIAGDIAGVTRIGPQCSCPVGQCLTTCPVHGVAAFEAAGSTQG
jgi:hypothetical protein